MADITSPVASNPLAVLATTLFNSKVRTLLAASGGALLMKAGLDAASADSLITVVSTALAGVIPILATALWSSAEKKLVALHLLPLLVAQAALPAPQNPPAG